MKSESLNKKHFINSAANNFSVFSDFSMEKKKKTKKKRWLSLTVSIVKLVYKEECYLKILGIT